MCIKITQSTYSYFLATHVYFIFFFFFSSRRRHTRFDCDWSSDVCSSDLSSNPKKGDFAALLHAEVETEAGSTVAAGTLFGDQYVRLVQLGPFRMEGYRSGEGRGGEEGRSRGAADH